MSDEIELYLKEHGMELESLKPSFTVELTKDEVTFLKDAAKFKTEQERWTGHGLYWEAAYLSEFGLHKKLKEQNKRHKWASLYFGDAAEASVDFIIRRNERKYTVGVSSRRHKDLIRYADNPVLFYPYRRLNKANEKIGDYTISSSVITNGDDSVSVAYWGAMTRKNMIKNMATQKPITAHPTQGDFVKIPLHYFSATLLRDLIENIDNID